MKISILTPDFSNNCFGRAWLLAKLLEDSFDIEIVGPAFGDGIWKPFADLCNFQTKMVKGSGNGGFEFRRMLKMITGDILYASKPLPTSYGVALVKKLFKRIPILLDIDDYEIGFGREFYNSLRWYKKINDFRLSARNVRSYYYALLSQRLIPLASAVTVSGKTLQKLYGGTIIWHSRDSNLFNPQKFDKKTCMSKYLPEHYMNHLIIGFIGTPRPHKGIEDLLDAIVPLKHQNILLTLTLDQNDEHCRLLKKKVEKSALKDITYFLPEQPFENLPEILSFIDLIVVPQRQKPAAHGQVPAKIFDAMAMAKPIIATNVYEIPDILGDCGFIVEPENPGQIAQKIQYVLANRATASEIGMKAQNKYLREYSWNLSSKNLKRLITSVGKIE